jgi:hypothetical protein
VRTEEPLTDVRLSPARPSRWEPRALALVLALIAVKGVLHFALVNRYGYHGDELYFIDCGRHLALGYVDHAPLVPWIARMTEEIGGASLVALRLPAILASLATMAFTALLVREWEGGARAQLVALLSLLVAPAYLRMAVMLNIPVFEVCLATSATYLVARALGRGERRTWLLAGAVVGVGLMTKHTMLLWAGCLGVGLVATHHRRVLRKASPWLGLLIAALVFLPNVLWQMQNGFPTAEFSAALRRDLLVEQGRALFALAQLLYFHPLVVPVWASGLVLAFTEPGRAMRPFAVLFVTMFAALFIVGGKPYYLASAYPAVLACGGIAIERWLRRRDGVFRVLIFAMVTTGVALGLLTLPLLPIRAVDGAIERLLGWIVPPMALTHDMHGELGWEAHVATIDRVVASLSPEARGRAAILTGSYWQAAALDVLREDPTPRAVSGHMTYYLWGPEPGRGEVLIAYGLPRELLTRHYELIDEAARIVAPDARPWDTDLPVYVCRQPRDELAGWWSELRRFDHGIGRPD